MNVLYTTRSCQRRILKTVVLSILAQCVLGIIGCFLNRKPVFGVVLVPEWKIIPSMEELFMRIARMLCMSISLSRQNLNGKKRAQPLFKKIIFLIYLKL